MAFRKKLNFKTPTNKSTGFGANASNYGGRFINKSGDANITKSGIGFLDRISWYHTLLTVPRWKFFVVISAFYFIVNLFFASLYMAVGIEHLKGIVAQNDLDKFGQAFFFSVQTFTTVGYGHISPSGFLSSLVASLEALFGLLSFAIATGLFYGRFSRAKAHIAFSNYALIAPFQNQTALMFRIAPYKNTNLFDAEATIIMGIPVEEHGVMVNKFYSLALELDKISTLTLSWTLVHPITEESPLFQMKEPDFQSIKGEIIVYVKAFDDMYSTTVVKRTSYTFKEVCYGARFVPMFSKNDENTQTILHLDKLHQYEKVSL